MDWGVFGVVAMLAIALFDKALGVIKRARKSGEWHGAMETKVEEYRQDVQHNCDENKKDHERIEKTIKDIGDKVDSAMNGKCPIKKMLEPRVEQVEDRLNYHTTHHK